MKKLRIGDLEKIRNKIRRAAGPGQGKARAKVTVHMGTCGIAAGAREIMAAMMQEIQDRQLNDVIVAASGCAGLCSREPMATIEITGEPPVKYVDLTPEKIKLILNQHVIDGDIVIKLAFAVGSERTH